MQEQKDKQEVDITLQKNHLNLSHIESALFNQKEFSFVSDVKLEERLYMPLGYQDLSEYLEKLEQERKQPIRTFNVNFPYISPDGIR